LGSCAERHEVGQVFVGFGVLVGFDWVCGLLDCCGWVGGGDGGVWGVLGGRGQVLWGDVVRWGFLLFLVVVFVC